MIDANDQRNKGSARDPKHKRSLVKHGGGNVMAWASCLPLEQAMM